MNDVSRDHKVPLEGLEPPTLSLGRNCSSIELQRPDPQCTEATSSPDITTDAGITIFIVAVGLRADGNPFDTRTGACLRQP